MEKDFDYPTPPAVPAVTAKLDEARTHLKSGDGPGALAACNAALALDTAFPPTHLCLAIADVWAGNLDGALVETYKATEKDPNYAMALFWRARIRVAQGHNDEDSYKLYWAVLTQHPDEPVVISEFAQLMLALAKADPAHAADWLAAGAAGVMHALLLPDAAEAPALFVQSVLIPEAQGSVLAAQNALIDVQRRVKDGETPDSQLYHLLRVRITLRAILLNPPDEGTTAMVVTSWCDDHTCKKAAPIPVPEGAVETVTVSGFDYTNLASNDVGIAYSIALMVAEMHANTTTDYMGWMRDDLALVTAPPLAPEAAALLAAIETLDGHDEAARAALMTLPDQSECLRLWMRPAHDVRDHWNAK